MRVVVIPTSFLKIKGMACVKEMLGVVGTLRKAKAFRSNPNGVGDCTITLIRLLIGAGFNLVTQRKGNYLGEVWV